MVIYNTKKYLLAISCKHIFFVTKTGVFFLLAHYFHPNTVENWVKKSLIYVAPECEEYTSLVGLLITSLGIAGQHDEGMSNAKIVLALETKSVVSEVAALLMMALVSY